jgi:RNA polymerase sigma-70 factor (ECF subfamily)
MDARDDIRDLIAAARSGAPDALGRIFEAARGHLLELADRELPAELRAKIGPSDLVQETAIDMHRDFVQFTGTTAAECFSWLREILRNNAVDAIRHYRVALKRDVGREVSLTSTPARGDPAFVERRRTPDGSAIRREEANALGHVFSRLPAEYRLVLELRYWGGLSFVDIAPRLGRSPEAVRKLWYRAVERVQEELSGSTVAAAEPGDPLSPRP